MRVGHCLLWGSTDEHYLGAMNTRDFTSKLEDCQEQVTETARNLGNAANKYVRENTWASIGVAALLGCVVGYLLASRSSADETNEEREKQLS